MKLRLDMNLIARGLRARRRGTLSATAGCFGALQLLAHTGGSQPYDRALEYAVTQRKNVALEPDVFARVAEEAEKQGLAESDVPRLIAESRAERQW